jgi:hypothetical protein
MKPLILNVDDNESGRYVKTRVMRQGGYEVIEARTGIEALEMARRERPDLVLLDVKLPDINGFEVCRLIKKQDVQLLVLQISASFVAPQDRAVGLNAGADSYLSQPVEPAELLATIRALLRLKRAEQAAEQSNELYRVIVQSVVDHAIVTVDQNGVVQSWSEGAHQVLGWSEVEMIGQSADCIYTAEDVAGDVPHAERQRAATEATVTSDRWHLRKDGRPIWASCVMAPLQARGSAGQGFILVLRDLTTEKTQQDAMERTNAWLEREVAVRTGALTEANRRLRAEIEERQQAEAALRQVQKMEAIGQLTGGIAHDFNNMLTVVLGSTEALKKALPVTETAQHRRADLVMQAAMQAAALTHRLLAFARRQPSDPKPVNLNALVGGLTDMLRRTIGESVELEIDLEDDLPPVTIDSNQLENALLNLAVNARDAMPGGGKMVVRTLSRGDHVLLTVSDTGIGMSEETQRRAFEPFFTTKRQGEGTGLGLAQVASFIAQAEGSLDVVSSEGKGTTIRLSFPRLPEGTAVTRDALPETGVFNGKGRHALVVEDQQGVREHVAESLRQLGFDVATAADALAARSHVDAGHPVDLLMSDIGLPGGTDGWQVADYMRKARPGLRIVLMTGYAQPNAEPLGPDTELIMKPFVRSTLELRLTRLFGRERA